MLCDNNATPATVTAVQQGLRKAGFDPGRDDGKVEPKTMTSVRGFQQAKGLPVDGDRWQAGVRSRLLVWKSTQERSRL